MGIKAAINLDVFTRLEVLSLSLNKISTLEPFASCLQLKELHLRKNSIVDIDEIYYLTKLSHLHTLLLSDNPCCAVDGYRNMVVGNLEYLRKLDSIPVSDTEREESLKYKLGTLIIKQKNINSFEALSNPKCDSDDTITELTNHPTSHRDSNILQAVKYLIEEMDENELKQIIYFCNKKIDDKYCSNVNHK